MFWVCSFSLRMAATRPASSVLATVCRFGHAVGMLSCDNHHYTRQVHQQRIRSESPGAYADRGSAVAAGHLTVES